MEQLEDASALGANGDFAQPTYAEAAARKHPTPQPGSPDSFKLVRASKLPRSHRLVSLISGLSLVGSRKFWLEA